MAPISQRLANRLVVGSVIGGFLGLMLIGLTGITVMRQNLAFTDLVAHTYQVQNAISEFRIQNERMETARRGYLLSDDSRFVAVFERNKTQLPQTLSLIEKLTVDNPNQQARVRQAREIMGRQIAAAEASVHERAAAAANFDKDEAVLATRRLRDLTLAMANDEGRKLALRNDARVASIRTLVILIAVAGLLTAGIGIGSLWVIFRNIRDISASRAALAELNEGLEDEVRTRTAELRRANEEIQRFAYIVSHDLRSPLVNVMGFTAELEAAAKPLGQLLDRAEVEAPSIVTADARAAVTADLPEALGFIRASTQKMDRLINAILQLSRQGRRVLAPESVDLTTLFTSIAGSLKHRADELGATIEVTPNMPRVGSDRLALEQIFSNLIENALKYLKPGRPGHIVLRAHRRGERVIVEVTDNGRGIDPKDHDRIFDLFRRSGVQDQPGEGIGLAHVRALGFRLGATVSVESALDQGATFRVSLPANLSLETAAA